MAWMAGAMSAMGSAMGSSGAGSSMLGMLGSGGGSGGKTDYSKPPNQQQAPFDQNQSQMTSLANYLTQMSLLNRYYRS